MTIKKWTTLAMTLVVASLGFVGCTGAASEEPVQTQETEVAVTVAEEAPTAEQAAREALFISVEQLKGMDTEGLVIVDARGEDAYNGGHIPNAVVTSWQQLSTMDVDFATPTWGSVVNAEALSKGIAGLGIDGNSHVVVYADTEKGWGEDGRVYWTLKMAGLENVQILDGGVNLWNDAGETLSTEAMVVEATDFAVETLDFGNSVNTVTLSDNLLDYKIVDTRDYDEYEGAVKFGEARGGHLPGAIHLGYKSLLNKDGSLKTNAELEAIFAEAGLKKTDKIATYCTAGIRSAHVAVIMDMLGYEDVANYDESYYVWANDPTLKLGRVVKEKPYNYYTQEDLKGAMNSEESFMLVDIQVEDEYSVHHIQGAIETNAFPVKTEEEQAKLETLVADITNTNEPVVIVCPRGGGGAQRTVQYFEGQGIPSAQLYILEKGQEGWPYEELLEK